MDEGKGIHDCGGQSASAKFDYLGREGRYSKEAEELEYKESGNMPAWAEDDPGKYWQAADEHERTNGRLFQQVEVALPVELDERQRRYLARSFAEKLTGPERPYTLAIHRGEAKNPGDKNNPHAHLMISERGLDGHARSAETWFKRANKRNPKRGGALKSRELMNPDWIAQTRQVWEQEANRALERAGRSERINHRSLAEQYAQAQKEYAEWANRTTALAEDHQKMGAHVTKLTDAYESANASHNALVRDLDELFR